MSNINHRISQSDELTFKDFILSIKEWLNYLIVKRALIFIVTILGVIIGYLYGYFNKPIYVATTTFVLEEEKSASGSLSSLSGLASMAGIDLGGGGGGIFQGDNILQLYQSRKMIERTLFTTADVNGKDQLLINLYIESKDLRREWEKKPQLANLQFKNTSDIGNVKLSRLQDSIITEIVKKINSDMLSVSKPDKKLSFIKAVVSSENEFFAKSFNDAIVKNVSDFYIQTRTKKSQQNVQILESKRDSIQGVINGAINTVASVNDATPNLNPIRQRQRIAPSQKSQFTAEANKAILSALIQNLEMAKVALVKDAPLIQVVDDPVYPLHKIQFGKIKGLVFGGLIGFFVISLLLVSRRVFLNLMK